MAARGPRRALLGAPRSARPSPPAEGVYSAGSDGERLVGRVWMRVVNEGLDEGDEEMDGVSVLHFAVSVSSP